MRMNEDALKNGWLTLSTERTGYGVDQIRATMTIKELKEYLEQFDDDDERPIFFSNDNGYTYGGFTENSFEECEPEEDEEEG